MNNKIKYPFIKRLLMFLCLLIFTIIYAIPAAAQEKPPRPISVKLSVVVIKDLNFGSFCHTDESLATVSISPEGARSYTGGIVLINSSFSAAYFDVESIPGTLVTINESIATLSGSNGGTMQMHITNSNFKSPFITTSVNMQISIGGTLNVDNSLANPAGAYSGYYSITFNQQ